MKIRHLFVVMIFLGMINNFASASSSDGNEYGLALSIKLWQPGELEEVLGDDIWSVTDLTIWGALGPEDFYVLRKASIDGRLTYLDLQNACPQNYRIPEFAFYRRLYNDYHPAPSYQSESEETEHSKGYIHLRRIILPSNLKSIGDYAFNGINDLEEVIMPESLESIGAYVFQHCLKLRYGILDLPESLTRIGDGAFDGCLELASEVRFPSSIRTIGDFAFWMTGISAIDLPEGLESIGGSAFGYCNLSSVTLPKSCVNLPDGGQFTSNENLACIEILGDIEAIPDDFASECNLVAIPLPHSVRTIGSGAFMSGSRLKTLILHEGVERLEMAAFKWQDALTDALFPSTLKYLGHLACAYWDSVENIYCAASEPPVCDGDTFRGMNYTEVTLWVPVGSKEIYRQAEGWRNFINIVETDNFSLAGLKDPKALNNKESLPLYDLMGRPVANPQPGSIYIRNGKKVVMR